MNLSQEKKTYSSMKIKGLESKTIFDLYTDSVYNKNIVKENSVKTKQLPIIPWRLLFCVYIDHYKNIRRTTRWADSHSKQETYLL